MTENLSDIKNRFETYIANNSNIAGDRIFFYIIQDMIALSEIELAKTAISYFFKGNEHLREGNIPLAVLYMQIAIKSHDKESFYNAEKIFQSKPRRSITDRLFSILRAEYYIAIKDCPNAQTEIKQLQNREETLSAMQKEKLNSLILDFYNSRGSVGIFWKVQNKWLFDKSNLNEAEPYGDISIGHATSHSDFWDNTKQNGEYINFPRGRVIYYPSTNSFTIYLDRRLQNKEDTKKIKTVFRLLKENCNIKSDPHYREL